MIVLRASVIAIVTVFVNCQMPGGMPAPPGGCKPCNEVIDITLQKINPGIEELGALLAEVDFCKKLEITGVHTQAREGDVCAIKDPHGNTYLKSLGMKYSSFSFNCEVNMEKVKQMVADEPGSGAGDCDEPSFISGDWDGLTMNMDLVLDFQTGDHTEVVSNTISPDQFKKLQLDCEGCETLVKKCAKLKSNDAFKTAMSGAIQATSTKVMKEKVKDYQDQLKDNKCPD